ncbi:hypothetical protein B0T10DRAFT_70834 [Thelonectria olida]|uniref:Ubiquitin-like protease family profile domain-containing protein n=1 Tax=Thelonectria olida TaxID=1576542 RepID=A0A9P8VMS9_9HYPO|nr:hypothetical protein B0T10DRAFT_70834 [Thelonectria olida]
MAERDLKVLLTVTRIAQGRNIALPILYQPGGALHRAALDECDHPSPKWTTNLGTRAVYLLRQGAAAEDGHPAANHADDEPHMLGPSIQHQVTADQDAAQNSLEAQPCHGALDAAHSNEHQSDHEGRGDSEREHCADLSIFDEPSQEHSSRFPEAAAPTMVDDGVLGESQRKGEAPDTIEPMQTCETSGMPETPEAGRHVGLDLLDRTSASPSSSVFNDNPSEQGSLHLRSAALPQDSPDALLLETDDIDDSASHPLGPFAPISLAPSSQLATDAVDGFQTEPDRRRKALHQLSTSACLSDDVIELLQASLVEFVGVSTDLTKILVLDPLYFETRSLPRACRQEDTAKIFSCMFHPFPTPTARNIPGHWTLAAIDVTHGKIEWYDPLPSEHRAQQTQHRLLEWASHMVPSKGFVFSQMIGPRQTDTSSCGVFVLEALYRVLQNQPLPQSCCPSQSRLHLAGFISQESSIEKASTQQVGSLDDSPRVSVVAKTSETSPQVNRLNMPQQHSNTANTDKSITRSSIVGKSALVKPQHCSPSKRPHPGSESPPSMDHLSIFAAEWPRFADNKKPFVASASCTRPILAPFPARTLGFAATSR